MIYLLVGNTGSGKTTYALHLKKKTHGVIFSIDNWNKTLFLADKGAEDGLDWMLDRIERVETMMQDLIIQLQDSKVDIILDLGFSKFEHREKFRRFAAANQMDYQLHYLDVPKEIRWQRVQQRNIEKGNTFQFEVSTTDFNFMESWFEAPKEEELSTAIVIKP